MTARSKGLHTLLQISACDVHAGGQLELTLSMAGFAAGIAAMIAGIFGKDLESMYMK